MNLRLSEDRIHSACRELLAKQDRISGRALCVELRKRFGAVGKTERVFKIWREETIAKANATAPAAAASVVELQRRLAAAEAAAAENLARAERAEYREQAHQEKWAVEVDRLRMEVKRLRGGR
jgi:Plasmid replication region DNA-binding N-term